MLLKKLSKRQNEGEFFENEVHARKSIFFNFQKRSILGSNGKKKVYGLTKNEGLSEKF